MDRISDTASQMFDFVNQTMSWRTATITVGGLALLAYQNEKRQRLARTGNPSLMKVRIPAVQPSLHQERRLSRALRTSQPTGGIRKRSSGDASLARSSPVRLLSAQYRRADGKSCFRPLRPKPLPKKNARLTKFLEAVTGALKECLGYESLPDESTKKMERLLLDSGFTPAPGSLFGPKKPELPSPFTVQSKPSGPVSPNFNPTGPKLKSDFEANIFGAKPESPKSTGGSKQPDPQSLFTFQSQPCCTRRALKNAGFNGCPGDKSFEDSCYADVCRRPFTHTTRLQDRLNAGSVSSSASTKVHPPESRPDSESPFARKPYSTIYCSREHSKSQQDTTKIESTLFGSAPALRPSFQPPSSFKNPETPEATAFQPMRNGICDRYRVGSRHVRWKPQPRRTSRAQKTLGFSAVRTVDPNKKMSGGVAPGDEHAREALKDKIEHYQNSTVCDAESTVQNTHQPWRLVSSYEVVRLIPFDAHPDDAVWLFPDHFHTTYNVVAWVLQRLSNEVLSDYDLVNMLMKFGSDLKGRWADVEYMVSYDHPSEWDEMQRGYWGAIKQLKSHMIPSLGVERRGDDLVTAGEKHFHSMGWKMEVPIGMRGGQAEMRGNQAGLGGFGSRWVK